MIEWFSSVWTIVLVAVGIGGVIFVHECGHFFAARWCRVRVETFSLGFGPRLFGWKRGGTTYQLALLPLGGYVKMAGEEGVADRAPAPDELPAKSVGQRFFIYSGGVLANVVFGLIVFPILFAIGVPFLEPVLGPSDPGSPAWHAGLVEGSRVKSVNGAEVISFLHIPTEVALGSPERTELVVVEPDGKERSVVLTPRYNEALGAYSIGVQHGVDPQGLITVAKDSPAEKAGLKTGDRLLSVESPLPTAPPKSLSLEEQLIFVVGAQQPVRGHFERDGRGFDAEIVPESTGGDHPGSLGVLPVGGYVQDLIQDELVTRVGLALGDRVLTINARPIWREHDVLPALLAGVPRIELAIERAGAERTLTLDNATPEDCVRLWRSVHFNSDVARTRVAILPGSAAERAGLQDGDRILKIDGAETKEYEDVKSAIKSKKGKGEIALLIERRGATSSPEFKELHATLSTLPDKTYGLALAPAQYTYRSSSPLAAVQQGWHASWKFIEEGWLTLKRILNRQVSGDNIGGIITISVVSHRFAEHGLVSLLFFLCMLSMNLAFLNVLPIPVLDGGHLFFLLVEKIKGSPVSEKVLGYSQMVGIVVLLSLMVYVTFKDVMRWIVKP